MKKIDYLVLRSFIGPFVLTTLVVIFIFLMRFLMMYFEDLVSKELDLTTYGQLFGYFALMTIPISLPLATLLASLMSFGNLGEHVELTAIKSAGIPLPRIILPVGLFALGISLFSFWFGNRIAPWANLKGYSLLYDIRTAKVSVNLTEGIFYNEIPNYNIKVRQKEKQGDWLRDIIIYDHTKNDGNTSVTIADSGKMYSILGNSHLILELYNGANYSEQMSAASGQSNRETQYLKNTFKSNKIVFSLESFGMKRTDENQFKYHELMKTINELDNQVDSTRMELKKTAKNQVNILKNYSSYQFKPLVQIKDSLKRPIQIKEGAWIDEKMKFVEQGYAKELTYENAYNQSKSSISQLELASTMQYNTQKLIARAEVEKWHRYTMALACFIMFLIGASLGSIIKKGGFGMPVLIAISFFIFMYVLMQLGDKYAKEGLVEVLVGVWFADFVLAIIALFLLRKASNDSRLLEGTFMKSIFTYLKDKVRKKRLHVSLNS
ncbi:MAG: LptF/LptG family permease [Spirosomataceae bacterium]